MIDCYDFGGKSSQVYSGGCECGKIVEVSTQRDEEPEYYVRIFVKCSCGKSVQVRIPVN